MKASHSVGFLVACSVVFASSLAVAEEAAPGLARARFSTNASVAEIRDRACALRTFDVRVDEAPCSALPVEADTTLLDVRTEVSNGKRIVTLEAESSEAVSHAGLELERELAQRPTEMGATQRDETPVRSDALRAIGYVGVVVGGIAMGAGTVVGIGTVVVGAVSSGVNAVDRVIGVPNSSTNVSGGAIAALSLLAGGAASLILGVVAINVGGQRVARVSAYVAPSGGGVSVVF